MNGRRSQSKAKTQDTRGKNPPRDDNNGRPKQGRNRKRDATSGVEKTSKMSEKSPRRRKDKRDRETATRPEDTLGEAVSGYRANVTAPSKSKKSKVKKLISLSSFQLKGDGWYSTDYARKPKVTHTSAPTEGQDATKQSIESTSSKKDGKAVADSISKDIKKAKG